MWTNTQNLMKFKICELINPKNEKGKITLISRFGHDKVEKFLPKLIRAIKKEGLNVIWSCDPCMEIQLNQQQDLRQDHLIMF